ncbi:lipopolysaccharide biosynthesis protein [Telluribacter humicola]|uniref:lipopolysaccharide biosynthesis protein n=1 Tax=Telluribacter humicola TaxID=1720261 RepID=UPI001A95821E|nr:hypothetical protein [Telluribacter humicola]
MSSAKRIISGSFASWTRIGITLLTQIAIVPIYLTYWSVEEYGIWIGILSLVSITTILDQGHIEYLGNEFLKIGASDKNKISALLSSGLLSCLCIGIAEFAVLSIIIYNITLFSPYVNDLLAESLSFKFIMVFILQWISLTFVTNFTGLLYRALIPFGYYPRTVWWDVVTTLITTIVPLIGIIYGDDILAATVKGFIALVIIQLFKVRDIVTLFKSTQLSIKGGSYKTGFDNYKRSLILSGRYLLDNFRQQGIRLILAPILGARAVANFSTIRTGANVAQQGLLTITQPLLPELMNFLNEKEQNKSEAAFSTIWLVVVVILAPGIVTFQLVAEPLYSIWTKGAMPFDPILFALFSLVILVFAVAQPAVAIAIGNNLIRSQIIISAICTGIVLITTYILYSQLSILSAGIALLLAELLSLYSYKKLAKEWLLQNGLRWPDKASKTAELSVWVAGATVISINLFPNVKWTLLIVGVSILVWNMWRYQQCIPKVAKLKVYLLVNNLSIIRHLRTSKFASNYLDQLSNKYNQ